MSADASLQSSLFVAAIGVAHLPAHDAAIPSLILCVLTLTAFNIKRAKIP
jgi:hypothetical protein